MEITLRQEQTKNYSDQHDNINHVHNMTSPNEGRIDPLEDDGPETTKKFVLDLRETENNVQKNAHDISSQSQLLKKHTDNINIFISSNATFKNQSIALETKSEKLNNLVEKQQPKIKKKPTGWTHMINETQALTKI